ncbi:MAG TPA: hypothetical protein VG848_11885 [Acetobacteraceae bacterium]|jgi:hypothetical protein|nr:hypothetical protein [Acetobacteraceae bacterium]
MSGRQPPRSGFQTVVLGIALIARGRPEGLTHFGDTPQSFLASLAPLVAFPLVGAALLALNGAVHAGMVSFLETLSVLLAQPVISELLAAAWGREKLWLRYATAFNWCQWVIPVLGSLLIVIIGVLVTLGMPSGWGMPALLGALGGYGLWLQWFLAKHGLALGGWRAGILVLLVNLGTAALLLGPHFLLGWA